MLQSGPYVALLQFFQKLFDVFVRYATFSNEFFKILSHSISIFHAAGANYYITEAQVKLNTAYVLRMIQHGDFRLLKVCDCRGLLLG